jgi:acetyltransferase
MSIRHLDKIFKPQRVAVIGASDDRTKVGYNVLRNLIGAGFGGVVYPINARREAVQGIQAYPNIGALPRPPDLAIVCTPATGVPELVRECGEAGVRGMVIVSAGFREAGPEGRALEERVLIERNRFDDLRIIGPNCLGVIAPHVGLNASFAADMPERGHIALISQSGALCTSLLDWAGQQKIGFSSFVSVGNMLDVGFGDLIDYFGADPGTKSIILYVESLTNVREFMSAARAFSRNKPIVAYKAGRFTESAKAATSHTGAMAGEDAVCDAAFQRCGIERVFDMGELFDCAELLARQKLPRGPRLAIVTNAGGPGVMATDTLIAARGKLATLNDSTVARLDAFLPAWWSHGNPVDVLGDAPAERFEQAVNVVLSDENVDAVLTILTPQAMTDPTETAVRVAAIAGKAHKPLLSAWIGGRRVLEGDRILAAAGVATYGTPEAAVKAFMHLVSYARNLETLYETPRDVPVQFSLDAALLRTRLEQLASVGATVLSESDSKSLLETYDIPVSQALPSATVDEASLVAARIGYPVVLKVLSPQITHKTDVGGVALNIRNEEGLRTAFGEIMRSAREKRPDAEVLGVTVQRMLNLQNGVELIVGMKTDATFGAVIMVGAGGVTAELFRDRALGLPPLNERLARRMLESLLSWPLLSGYRGRPAVNLERLVEVLMRLSYLTAHHPEVREFDVNPLLATVDDVVALDARIVVERKPATRTFAHLAIRPYPEEFVKRETLPDGQTVIFRPVRPEDEPAWLAMVANCSPETLHARFRSFFKEPTHDVATRFCVLDYDRELAIVAETADGSLIGVGRLVSDANHVSAEFALLVVDAWQNKGLGLKLTDYCLKVATNWGVKRVVAETTLDNGRMLSIFEQFGFHVDRNFQERMAVVSKAINT